LGSQLASKGRPAISNFEQEDGCESQAANYDVNLEQRDGIAACHRASRTSISEDYSGDNDCPGQLIEPRSRRADSNCGEQHNVRPSSYDKKIGLVLQGGGALGSYQAGVYEALASSEYLPDWVAGISIGAINAAIIVGNTPENRVKRLRSFWEEVTAQPPNFSLSAPPGSPAICQQKSGALTALMYGQPGFFTPRAPKDWLSPSNLVSYYDTSVLKGTLERLVDFNRINNAEDMRSSVGAVNVRTGQFSYFDSAKMTIRPEHVMASSALPPGFPPIEIDGEHYWDGGLFSNTPLEYVLDYSPRRSRLTFQVDLFHAQGRLPTNLDEVSERDKDIRYSSRTNVCSNAFRDRHNVRHAINELHKLLPPELASTEQAKRLYEYGCVTEMDIVRLIYRPVEPQGASKTYDFSRSSMEKRWQQGRSDARTVLHASPWLAPAPKELGVRVFDVLREDSHQRNDNLPMCSESHVGIDSQPPGGRRSPIRENLVSRGRSLRNDEPTENILTAPE
jgi:NTE family protein